MKKTALLSLCACLTAAGASAAPFSSPRGYSLTPPPGWRVDRSHTSGNDVTILADNTRETAAAPLVPACAVKIVPATDGLTLQALKQPLMAAYRHEFTNVTVVSQTYSLVGGVQGLDTTFTHPKDGTLIRDRQLVILKNHSFYFFTTVCPDSIHAKYDPIFAKILASVRWRT